MIRTLFYSALAATIIACGCVADAFAQTEKPFDHRCDLNFDQGTRVTIADYAVFLGALGKKRGEAGFDYHADRDASGAVTIADWGKLLTDCPLSH